MTIIAIEIKNTWIPSLIMRLYNFELIFSEIMHFEMTPPAVADKIKANMTGRNNKKNMLRKTRE